MFKNSGKKLPLKFDSRTIGDLGIKMYTRLPHALAESISNAYDADAKNVTVSIQQEGNNVESITIEDNGFGMSYDDLKDHFLVVGRKRREEDGDKKTPGGRHITGRKGLGKLAMFGIADIVEVRTVRGGKLNTFKMDWRNIEKSKDNDCSFDMEENNVDTQESDGTKITLTQIKRKTKIDIEDLAIKLSRRFNFDKNFSVMVKGSKESEGCYELSNDLKTEGINIEDEFPVGDEEIPDKHKKFRGKIRGIVKTAKKPLPQEMQGVTLFARNKLVNEPAAFGSVSNNFFRYITGEIHIDFIDDFDEDMVATNRRTLDWDNEELKPLEDCLRSIINGLEKKWREMRKGKVIKRISENIGIDFEKYQENIPVDKRESVKSLFSLMQEHPEYEEKMVKKVLEIVPEYAAFHWRYLHPKLKGESEIFEDYTSGNYASAVTKAWEIYEMELKRVSGSDKTGIGLIHEVLNIDGGNYGNIEPHVNDLHLKNNLKNSNFFIAKGVCAIANITRHHETKGKREMVDFSKSILTDQDCLDMLSSVSHLLYRLDKYHKSSPSSE